MTAGFTNVLQCVARVSDGELMHGGELPPFWTVEELLAWVEGAQLRVLDAGALPTDFPTIFWTLDGRQPEQWAPRSEAMHVDDRSLAATTWLAAIAHPGVEQRVEVRQRDHDRWMLYERRYLNLLHQDDIAAVLVTGRCLGVDLTDATVSEPALPDEANLLRSPAWMLQRLDSVGFVLDTEGMVDVLAGLSATELNGEWMLDHLHPDDHNRVLAMWMDVLDTPNATRTIRLRIVRPDDESTWVESTIMNRMDTDGNMMMLSLDVSAQIAEAAELRASRAELQVLAEELPSAVFRAELDGRITFHNAQARALVGDRPPNRITDLAHPADHLAIRIGLAKLALGAAGDGCSIEVRSPDLSHHVSITCRLAAASPSAAPVVIGVVNDVSDSSDLRRRADVDALTGLASRHALEAELATRLVEGDAMVAFLDLDGFKPINDELGHDTGDKVLAEIGRRLGSVVRSHDLAGRWGGDEFVLVLNLAPSARARFLLDEERETALRDSVLGRIERALAPPIIVGGRRWQPRASVGIVAAHQDEAVDEVMRRADAAMYAEKASRRGRTAQRSFA